MTGITPEDDKTENSHALEIVAFPAADPRGRSDDLEVHQDLHEKYRDPFEPMSAILGCAVSRRSGELKDFMVRRSSESFAQRLGTTSEALVGRFLFDSFPDGFARDIREGLLEAATEGKNYYRFEVVDKTRPEEKEAEYFRVELRRLDENSPLFSMHILNVSPEGREREFEKKMARTDELTGALNRYGFLERVEAEISRARRESLPTSVVFLDIDHFKKLNDIHGHEIGDLVLENLVGILDDASRASDVIGRWGGEEFLALLPNTDEAGAFIVAERLRLAVEERARYLGQSDEAINVTISLGVAEVDSSFEDARTRADKALYRSKHDGRNQVTKSSQLKQ